MSKKIVAISSSLHANSNSETLLSKFVEGAKAAGNEVTVVSLRGKKINFCVKLPVLSEYRQVRVG